MSDLVFYLVSNVQPKGKYRLRFPKADPTQITVARMRQQVRQITGIPEKEQILRYKGAILTDNETAASLGLVNEDTILLEAPSGQANPNTAVAATAPPPAPPPQPVAQPPPRGPPPRGPPPQQPPPPPPQRPVYQPPPPVGAAPAPFPPSPVRPLAPPPPPPPMFRGPPPPPPPAPIPDGRPWDPVPLYGGGGGPAPGPGPVGPLPQSTPIPLETARPLPPPRKGSPTRPPMPMQAMPAPPPPPPPPIAIQPAQMMPPPAPLQGSPFLDQVPEDCADAAMLWPLMEQIMDRKRQNSAMKREQEAVREARRLAYIQEHKDLIELKFKYEMEASRLREEIEDKKLALDRAGRSAQQVQQSIERLEISRQQDEQALGEQEQALDAEITVLEDQAHQLREKELACIRRQMWNKSEEQRRLKEERMMLLGERKVRQGGLDTQDRQLQMKIAEISRLEAALQRDWDDIERRRVALEEEKPQDDSNMSRVMSIAQVDHTIRNKERPRSRSATSVATTSRPVPPRAADIASREQRLEDRERELLERERDLLELRDRDRDRERERGDRRVVVEEYHASKRTAVTPGRYREQRSDSPASQVPPRGAVTPGARLRASDAELFQRERERGDRDRVERDHREFGGRDRADQDYDSRRGTPTGERDIGGNNGNNGNLNAMRSPLRPMPVRGGGGGGESREGSPRREVEYYQRTSRSGSPASREYEEEERYGRAPPAGANSPAAVQRGARAGSPMRPYNRP